jgi:hypothetical protein
VGASYGSYVVNINSKSAARKRVREAQHKANEARLERERQNVDDAASFLVELGRLVAVDEWERNRIHEIRAEGERRRHEHRQAGATAVARMQGRGESLSAIAELAGVKVGEVRAVLKAADAQAAPRADALGAEGSAARGAGEGAVPEANGATDAAAQALGSVDAAGPEVGGGVPNNVAAQTLGADAP